MFGRRKSERAIESAQMAAQQALAEREARRTELAELIQTAQTYQGQPSADGIILKTGEALFAQVSDASLVEDRKGAGSWEGRSSGFSIPVGAGVRYRVGQTRGHYVQGAPVATAIDNGTVFVTNRRVLFTGTKQTRECRFDRLVALQHDDAEGSTTLSVSNRQKPTVVHYGAKLAGWFDFRLDLALAHYRGDVPALVEQLQQELASLDGDPPPAA